MKRLNRILSLLLAVAMLLSLMIPTALADESASDIMSKMKVDAKAAMLVNLDTGNILYDQNGYEQVYPASLTKVMTALVVLRHIDAGEMKLSTKVTARSDCWDGLEWDASSQNIRPGEVLTVEELMQCMLIASASEAANILAQQVGGTVEKFVAEMNETAQELGCKDTHFANASGMPDETQVSTCYDLYLIGKAAMEYSAFREIVKMPEAYIKKTNMSEQRHFFNTNALLTNYRYPGYLYSNCIGIKTGSTEAAGFCLMSAAEQDGKTLLAVVMGCDNPVKNGVVQRKQYSESARLLKWGLENFKVMDIIDQSIAYGTVKVNLSTESDHVSVQPDANITAELPKDINPEHFTKDITILKETDAPVKKGDVLGTLTLSLDGRSYGTVNLIALNDVEASSFLVRKAQIQRLLSHWYVKAALAVLALLILLLLLRLTLFRGRRRSSYGGSRGGFGRGGGGYRGGSRRGSRRGRGRKGGWY